MSTINTRSSVIVRRASLAVISAAMAGWLTLSVPADAEIGDTGAGGSGAGDTGAGDTGAANARRAYVTGSDILAAASHVSDGSERAKGGPPRFEGPLGAQAVSANGYQYVIYYTGRDRSVARDKAFSQVVVARRKLGGFAWQRATVAGYKVTSDDAHNRQTIGISQGDGRIHIAFDHHARPQMNYAATGPGVTVHPDSVAWDDRVFTYAANLGGNPKTMLNVTYPSFKSFPGGNLVVYFRTGGSYGGDMRLAKYDAATGTWGKLHIVSSRFGTFEGLKTTRGPYLANGMQVGSDGALHAAWVFREKPCDFTTPSRSEIFCNHGLYYSRSLDEGRSWLRADGSQIADTERGEAISIDNIGAPVVDVPKGLGPSNPSITSTVDPVTGDMHVLLQHLDRPGAAQPSYFHYLGRPDGSWRQSRTNFNGNDATLAVIGDRLYAFVARNKGQIYYAERSAGFSQWQRLEIETAKGRTFNPQGGFMTWDISRLDAGQVTLLWHREPSARGVSSPIEVFDIALE